MTNKTLVSAGQIPILVAHEYQLARSTPPKIDHDVKYELKPLKNGIKIDTWNI